MVDLLQCETKCFRFDVFKPRALGPALARGSVLKGIEIIRLISSKTKGKFTVIEKLERLVDEVGSLHSKLVLLIEFPRIGKTKALLQALAKKKNLVPLNIGAELGRRLAGMPQRQRRLQTTTLLRELADQHALGDLLLLNNLELLFDRTLQLDPLDLLKRHAHVKRVVAVWPGELRDGRLTYAEMGHPEHQDYSLAGLVPFEIQ